MLMSIRQSSLILRCTPLLGALLLTACATKQTAPEPTAAATDGVQTVQERRILGFLTPYRPDVQQGNFISQEMVDQLRIGMTPAQVRFVLGTPLLTDIFHADRWDYPFRLQKGNGEIISSRVTVHFENDRLARIEGGSLPPEEKFLDLLTGGTNNN
jgi:outer membrane protein assembly factor BamE